MGRYKKISAEIKEKILESENPYILGATLGMARSTVYNLLKRGDATIMPRGGKRDSRLKIREHHLKAIVEWLEKSPDLTLRNISSELKVQFDVDVTPQCVAQHLDGLCYSIKQIRSEPVNMNSDEVKAKRKAFASEYMTKMDNGFTSIFEEETNFNVFCKHNNSLEKKLAYS